ncbi:hypothetical protein GSI_14683 [Ganoderma sinense ZZ0214-1]|uniref:Uncharacterized protein n=1 Tax=Ganoderma sinense ZZ0214-1 TaxID=1077348 RepID=A0A2G8RPE4_9APHY|nr:hypothetical protein GSI_14683 [Ganoderma sinense ZZ0214-1]
MSSPASSATSEVKQIRLRHPSRLHTRDLTSNTFRIYVKHYMDNAPPPAPRRRRSEARSVSPSPTPRGSRNQNDIDSPTNARGTKRAAAADATPRPSRRRRLEEGHTPRASQVSRAESDADSSDEEDNIEEDDRMYGFTLSHLRRVPELSLLARRVLAADARRREKEERKKAKEQASLSKGKGKAPASSSSSSRPAEMQVPTGPAVKKLYKQAIRTLFQEGDIVLWSGLVRPLPVPSLDPMLPASSASQLWRANTSTSSTISSASTSSRSQPNYEEWDDEVLSDPQPNEEAYVPLTPAYFSRVLEDAIRSMAHEKLDRAKGPQGERTPKPKPASKSIVERLREQEKERGAGPPPGPTKEELLTWLRNSDERWARVGEWTVQEALEWGRRDGRLWCIGKGRWEVCE